FFNPTPAYARRRGLVGWDMFIRDRKNTVQGGGGGVAVDEILKHKITHVIAGGMGMGAQQKFANAGVEVFGYAGNVQKALDDFMNNTLGGLDACKDHKDHGEGGGCH
ncbi:hypothetical protein D4Q80_01050, partial [bacterium]